MESVSASAGNPKEQRTMKQEPGRQQPGIPFLQGGEDVKKTEFDLLAVYRRDML